MRCVTLYIVSSTHTSVDIIYDWSPGDGRWRVHVRHLQWVAAFPAPHDRRRRDAARLHAGAAGGRQGRGRGAPLHALPGERLALGLEIPYM